MRNLGTAQRDFQSYCNLLDNSVGAVFRNAADSARSIRYEPLTAISRGYDSTTTATLAARNGCSESFVPYINGAFAPSLHRISCSNEMGPWRIGGSYDRPIAQRIVEQAGIPRDLFGQVKMGGDVPTPKNRALQQEVLSSFKNFYKDYAPEKIQSRLSEDYQSTPNFFYKRRPQGLEKRLRAQFGLRRVSERVLGHHGNPRHGSAYLYTYHWALHGLLRQYKRNTPDLFPRSML